jgi:polyprenyl-phospho-N-acetylgalactosaminyl synthase
MDNIWIVIAAYNEGKNIIKTLGDLKSEHYTNIVVVDDGSKDDTYNIAKSQGIIALKHIVNRGQGAALQTGMTYALKSGAEYIIHFDADGQHNAKEIKNILSPLKLKQSQVTLGSRFIRKQKIPFARKIILKGAILIIWMFYGLKLTDAHNGFRGFTKNAAKKVIITSDRMEHASEIIEKIKQNKIKYKEVPVTITYTKEHLKNGRKGQGKFDSIKILLKMILKKIGV